MLEKSLLSQALLSATLILTGCGGRSGSGTSANTSLVKDTNPDASGSYPAFVEARHH